MSAPTVIDVATAASATLLLLMCIADSPFLRSGQRTLRDPVERTSISAR
jgi:hypothetical protein